MDKENSAYSKKVVPIYLMKLLHEQTDKNHYITTHEIIDYLSKWGVDVDRRTVYSALTLLEYLDFGLEKVLGRGTCKYHQPVKRFSENELKFLIDAVAASKFLTETKSKELIDKIKKLGSVYSSEQLNRNVLLGKRIKSMNDKVLKNLDVIYTAINTDSKIKFQYMRWNTSKKLETINNGEMRLVSPYAVTLNDDNYYLVAFDDTSKELRHYRVDKMKAIKYSEELREGKEVFEDFNIAEYTQKTFGMYGGKQERIKLRFNKKLANVIFDRFGTDVFVVPDKNDFYTVNVDINVSPQFYGWLFGLGKDISIVAPEHIKNEFADTCKSVLENYNR